MEYHHSINTAAQLLCNIIVPHSQRNIEKYKRTNINAKQGYSTWLKNRAHDTVFGTRLTNTINHDNLNAERHKYTTQSEKFEAMSGHINRYNGSRQTVEIERCEQPKRGTFKSHILSQIVFNLVDTYQN